MPSPFPGMNPFLEEPAGWPNLHVNLITEIQAVLNRQLRPKYYARSEERVYVLDEDVVTLIEDEVHEPYIEIIDREQRRVVTVIEILSPTNKVPGSRGRRAYRRKRYEVMHSPSHWVEIDLLREGEPPAAPEALPAGEYFVHISRAEERPHGRIWPIRLPQRLPTIPVPLLAEDSDASLDLQAVLETVYDRCSFDLDLDYTAEPVPSLPLEYSEWTDQLLREKGLRS